MLALAVLAAVTGVRVAQGATPLTAGDAVSLHSSSSFFLATDQFIRIPVFPSTTSAAAVIVTSGGSTSQAPAAGQTTTAPAVPVRVQVIEYTVRRGETLGGVAQLMGVNQNSLVWSNPSIAPNAVKAGDVLLVPPIRDGVVHSVAAGNTLSGIAAYYNVSQSVITGYAGNGGLTPDNLRVGQRVIVPGGQVRQVAVVATTSRPATTTGSSAATTTATGAPAASNAGAVVIPGAGFVWPTRGPIFTYFSGYHPGIDISPPIGTPLYSTQGGTVINLQRTNYGYGWYVDIDHNNGYMSRYAHMSGFAVGLGSVVRQGGLIGYVGSTGNSTGPHVHFEIYRNGVPINPLGVLQ